MKNSPQKRFTKPKSTLAKYQLTSHSQKVIKACLENLKPPVITTLPHAHVGINDLIDSFPDLLQDAPNRVTLQKAIAAFIFSLGWTKKKDIRIEGKRKRVRMNPQIRLKTQATKPVPESATSQIRQLLPHATQSFSQPITQPVTEAKTKVETENIPATSSTPVRVANSSNVPVIPRSDNLKENSFEITDINGCSLQVGDWVGLSESESAIKHWERIIALTNEKYPELRYYPAAKIIALERQTMVNLDRVFVAIHWRNGTQFFYYPTVDEHSIEEGRLSVEQLVKMDFIDAKWVVVSKAEKSCLIKSS